MGVIVKCDVCGKDITKQFYDRLRNVSEEDFAMECKVLGTCLVNSIADQENELGWAPTVCRQCAAKRELDVLKEEYSFVDIEELDYIRKLASLTDEQWENFDFKSHPGFKKYCERKKREDRLFEGLR